MTRNRGQIHTLEAVIAALLVVGAVLFASQATAVTPLSASTAHQQIENQHQDVAEDLLEISAEEGTLQHALRNWTLQPEEDETGYFTGSDPNRSYYTGPPPEENPFGEQLREAFQPGIYAYNIELVTGVDSGEDSTKSLVRMGTPSDHAVTVTRTVVLFDSDPLHGNPEEDLELGDLDDDQYWTENLDSESPVHSIVEVRLTIWRM